MLFPIGNSSLVLPSSSSEFIIPGTVLYLNASIDLDLTGIWKDQSGNGNDVTAVGSLTLASAVIGGKDAVDCALGYFKNTSTNLVSAGSSYTVLSVGKASSAGAVSGTLLAIRSSGVQSGSMFLTLSGITYVWTDTVANVVQATADQSMVIASPFHSVHRYNGSGNAPEIWINESSIALVGQPQTTESGPTGFQVAANGAGQNWGSLIAELRVLNHAITLGERAAWDAYIASEYGL